jgi:hypothetical protein
MFLKRGADAGLSATQRASSVDCSSRWLGLCGIAPCLYSSKHARHHIHSTCIATGAGELAICDASRGSAVIHRSLVRSGWNARSLRSRHSFCSFSPSSCYLSDTKSACQSKLTSFHPPLSAHCTRIGFSALRTHISSELDPLYHHNPRATPGCLLLWHRVPRSMTRSSETT